QVADQLAKRFSHFVLELRNCLHHVHTYPRLRLLHKASPDTPFSFSGKDPAAVPAHPQLSKVSREQNCDVNAGRIATLYDCSRLVWEDRYVDLQAYNGEVLVLDGNFNSGTKLLLHSNDRGESFARVMNPVYTPIRAVPGKGVYSSCLYRLDDTSAANRVWVVNGSEIVYDDTIGVPDASIPYFATAMYINPADPSVWIVKIDRSTIGGSYEYLFMSVDRGTHWDLLPIPVSTYNGSARRILVRFDYSDSRAWFVGVNGRDVFGGEDKYEWHRTTDNGQMFTRVTDDLGYANGMYGSQTSVTFPYRLQLPWQREMSRGNIVIFHHATNTRDTIEWTKNIYASLFPNNDNANVDIYGGAYISGSDEALNFTYHPDRPGMFVIPLAVDSFAGSVRTHTSGVIATTDTGRTWKWIIKPDQQLNLQSMSIDPMDGAVYICVNGYKDPADKLNGFVLIRITPEKETSVPELCAAETMSVYPNPANSEVTVHLGGESEAEYIRITDLAGKVCMEFPAEVLQLVCTALLSHLKITHQQRVMRRFVLLMLAIVVSYAALWSQPKPVLSGTLRAGGVQSRNFEMIGKVEYRPGCGDQFYETTVPYMEGSILKKRKLLVTVMNELDANNIVTGNRIRLIDVTNPRSPNSEYLSFTIYDNTGDETQWRFRAK
ncbi:hypothetical protein G9A89_000588, partial [Geosiphon pyriformis]